MSSPANDPTPPSVSGPVEFAMAPALRARLLGTGLVTVGAVVVGGVLVTWVTGLPTAFVVGLLALAAIGVVTLGVLVGVRHWVLRLDADGYRVRVLRPEARSARWSDVLDLQASTQNGNRCVVLRLRDGRTTTLPVDLFEGTAARLTEALTEHLDRGHGYRRLR
ncbi:MAG: hypothetical protein JWR90_928 [Marmoricola sp.]|nr:hypothetical protein [Marmoricola sp.]